MKLFSGGGSRRSTEPKGRKSAQTQHSHAQKKPGSKKKMIIVLVVVLAILLSVAAACKLLVKPPSLAPHVNDNTIKDPVNGDVIQISEDEDPIDLNMGTRISDFFTFVVCATDIDETRTDNIMVVAFDTKQHTVNVMNVPRDLMSNVSRTGAARKINAAYGTKKGIQATKAEVKKCMGFTPDKYIVVNFQGIADIVNAIGGVDYEIPFPMMYKDPAQKLEINFPKAGMQHLNGEQVVEFLRWRKNGTGYTQYVPAEYKNGDETRIAKQQEFLKYLASQVLTLKNAPNIKKLADAVFNNVKTDITAGEMLWLAGQAWQVDTKNDLQMFTLPGYSAMSTAGTNDAYSFYFAYENKTLKLVNEYFNPYDKKITYLDLVSGPTKPTVTDTDGEDDGEEDPEEPVVDDPEGPDSDTDPEGNGPDDPENPSEGGSAKPSEGGTEPGEGGGTTNPPEPTDPTEPSGGETGEPTNPPGGGTEQPSEPSGGNTTEPSNPPDSGQTTTPTEPTTPSAPVTGDPEA